MFKVVITIEEQEDGTYGARMEAETAGQAEGRAVELAQRVADADLTVRQVTRDPWGSES